VACLPTYNIFVYIVLWNMEGHDIKVTIARKMGGCSFILRGPVGVGSQN